MLCGKCVRAIILACLLLPAMAVAKSEPAPVYVPSSTVIEGNYYAIGEIVEIAGAVTSDVIVAGGSVILSGAVAGDVITMGGNVRIIGPVGGNVRVLGGNVEIVGTVERNVMVGAGTLAIGESARIAGHVTAGAGTLELRGKIQGGLLAAGGHVIISGEISGPVNIYLDEAGQLEIRETAKTGSSFDYYSLAPVNISSGAQLAQSPAQHDPPARRAKSVSWWSFLITLFGALVVGMVLASLIPRKMQEAMEEAVANPWRALGWGVLWALLVPLVSIILIATLIGLPLALILLAIYLIGLMIAPVVAGGAVGWFMKLKSGEGWFARQNLVLIVLVGIIVYRLAVLVPWLGGVIGLLGALWGWGALLQVQRRLIQSLR